MNLSPSILNFECFTSFSLLKKNRPQNHSYVGFIVLIIIITIHVAAAHPFITSCVFSLYLLLVYNFTLLLRLSFYFLYLVFFLRVFHLHWLCQLYHCCYCCLFKNCFAIVNCYFSFINYVCFNYSFYCHIVFFYYVASRCKFFLICRLYWRNLFVQFFSQN